MSQTKAQLIEGLNINTSAPADALVINSSGQVVIGGTSPLDSDKQLTLTTTSTSGGLGILSPNNGRGDIFFGDAADDNVGQIKYSHVDNSLTIRTNAADRFVIASDGDVGIGTTSPSTKLHVQQSAVSSAPSRSAALYLENNANCEIQFVGNASNDCQLRFGTTSNSFKGALEYELDNNNLKAYTNGSERLRIDSSGNVAIGTTTADRRLHVKSTNGTVAHFESSNANTVAQVVFEGNGVSTPPILGAIGENLHFTTGNVERMRIDSSGNVGIGTTSPAQQDGNNNPVVHLYHATSPVEFRAQRGNGCDAFFTARSAELQIGTNTNHRIEFRTNDTERMRIDSSGNLLVGTTTAAGSMTVNMGTDKNISFNGNQGEVGNVPALVATNTAGSSLASMGFRATDLRFATGSAERMRIDSSGRLLVGGTSTTNTGLLCVKGNASSATGAAQLTLQKGAAVSGANQHIGSLNFGEGNANTATIKAFTNANWSGSARPTYMTFETTPSSSGSPTERMRIDQEGRVLVGNSLSSRTAGGINCHMHVEGTNANGSSLTLIRNTNGATNPPYLFFGKTRSGSTGGTTAVQGGDLLGYLGWQGADGNDLDGTAAAIQSAVDGTPGSNDMPGRLEFLTTRDGNNSPTIAMGINRNGELRMGMQNSDPVSTDQAHSIGDPNLDTVTTNLARLVMQERSGNWISFKDGGGTHYGTISRNPPGVTYGSNSDYRLKENVENLTNGITLVKQLRPVTFNWNESSGFDTTLTQRGFLAHEVQDVEPNAVVGDKDEMDRYGDCYDAEGRKTQVNVFENQAEEGETWTFQSEDIRHQQLDPAKLVPLLTAALQEAVAKIETLETQNADLLARVTALEAG